MVQSNKKIIISSEVLQYSPQSRHFRTLQ